MGKISGWSRADKEADNTLRPEVYKAWKSDVKTSVGTIFVVVHDFYEDYRTSVYFGEDFSPRQRQILGEHQYSNKSDAEDIATEFLREHNPRQMTEGGEQLYVQPLRPPTDLPEEKQKQLHQEVDGEIYPVDEVPGGYIVKRGGMADIILTHEDSDKMGSRDLLLKMGDEWYSVVHDQVANPEENWQRYKDEV